MYHPGTILSRSVMLAFVIPIAGLSPTSSHKESPARIARQRDGGVGPPVALNRILFTPSTPTPASSPLILPSSDPRALHVHRVLRLPSQGGTVRAGFVDDCLLDNVPVTLHSDGSVAFHLAQGNRRPLPPPPPVTLLLAVPRPKVLARLLPQVAALGVRNIILCNAYKVEKCYFDCHMLAHPPTLRPLLVEGISQSGVDARLPMVSLERRLKIYLEDRLPLHLSPTLLLAHPGAPCGVFQALSSPTARAEAEEEGRHVVLAVGPEGGWMPREVRMMEERFGFEQVGMGERILRTDAAVLVLLGLVHEALRVQKTGRGIQEG